MTAKVHHLKLATVGPGAKVDCNRVLRAAIGKLQNVVVIGWEDETGDLYFASSDGPMDTLWLIEQAKKELLSE
jgi:hypothetical protein